MTTAFLLFFRETNSDCLAYCGDQHFLLVAEPGALLDRESGALERGAHLRGDAPGRHGRVRRGEARHRAHQLRRPHVGFFAGAEAVEVDRVGAEPQLAQHLDVGEEERQDHASRVELRTVPSRHEQRPLRVQLGRLFLQLGYRS